MDALPSLMLTLPWPPSVNQYWRTIVIPGRAGSRNVPAKPARGRTLISEEGREYKAKVRAALRTHAIQHLGAARLSVHLVLHAPTAREYDLDNFRKAVYDALSDELEPAADAKAQKRPREVLHRGIWCNDSQIDRDSAERGAIVPGGCVEVRVDVLSLVDQPAGDLFDMPRLFRALKRNGPKVRKDIDRLKAAFNPKGDPF